MKRFFGCLIVCALLIGCNPKHGRIADKVYIPSHVVTLVLPDISFDGDGRMTINGWKTEDVVVPDAYFLTLVGTNKSGERVAYKEKVEFEVFNSVSVGEHYPPLEN